MLLMILQSSSGNGWSCFVLPKVMFWKNLMIISLNSGCLGCSVIYFGELAKVWSFARPALLSAGHCLICTACCTKQHPLLCLTPNLADLLSELKEKFIHHRYSVYASPLRLSSGTARIKTYWKQQNYLWIQIAKFFLFI